MVPQGAEGRLGVDGALPVNVDVVVAEDGECARGGAPLVDCSVDLLDPGVDLAPGG